MKAGKEAFKKFQEKKAAPFGGKSEEKSEKGGCGGKCDKCGTKCGC